MNTTEPIIIEPEVEAQSLVIWMHGLGADGSDFVPVVDQLGLDRNAAIRFIFPHAPIIPVTINDGISMRAWYDIISIDEISRELDHAGIDKNSEVLLELMHQQHQQGIDWSRMVVAGFSQGGVIASSLALCCQQPIAGLISLSSYFPFEGNRQVTHQPKAFVGHGRLDRVVPFSLGEQCQQRLTGAGFVSNFHSYDMDHSVCHQEIQDISCWLQQTLQSE